MSHDWYSRSRLFLGGGLSRVWRAREENFRHNDKIFFIKGASSITSTITQHCLFYLTFLLRHFIYLVLERDKYIIKREGLRWHSH